MLDLDNTNTYSPIIFIKHLDNNDQSNLLIYPNPVLDQISLQGFAIEDSKLASLSIFDATGKKVFEMEDQWLMLQSKLNAFVKNLHTGLYILQIQDEGNLLKSKFWKN
jgi:Secretion system C-terminal sorting domain